MRCLWALIIQTPITAVTVCLFGPTNRTVLAGRPRPRSVALSGSANWRWYQNTTQSCLYTLYLFVSSILSITDRIVSTGDLSYQVVGIIGEFLNIQNLRIPKWVAPKSTYSVLASGIGAFMVSFREIISSELCCVARSDSTYEYFKCIPETCLLFVILTQNKFKVSWWSGF